MKRIKPIFAACGLLAVTAVVFAGRPAFSNGVWADVGGSAIQLSTDFTTNLSNSPGTGGNQATISNQGQTANYPLYSDASLSSGSKLYLNPSY